jgi:cob(I)alamin adenosyltransferase
MKIYTRTGDDGTTGLLGKGRWGKDSPRIAAYGTVDELNAAIGVARASGPGEDADARLERVQDDLFTLGAALADPDPSGKFHEMVGPDLPARLEREIDELESELPPLTQFILPGGSPAAAHIHLARTVCRRAEREAVRLGHDPGEAVPVNAVIYLNRLSDFLFVLARAVNQKAGIADIPWGGPGGRGTPQP